MKEKIVEPVLAMTLEIIINMTRKAQPLVQIETRTSQVV